MGILTEPPSGEFACDVCVVGTGPVGIAFALECERLGLSVLAIEAGGEGANGFKARDKVEIVNRSSHAPISDTTCRAFGGTSWSWSGGCSKFDDIDFVAREHVPHSGWPLAHADVAPFYDRAAEVMNCRFDNSIKVDESWFSLPSVSSDTVVLHSAQPRLALSQWEHFKHSRAITLCLNSPVVGLELDDNGAHARAIIVENRGQRRVIRAPRIVLAAGGLRTTQLLLATQRQWRDHFGGEDGALGRYYMGHLSGCIASIKFNDHADAEGFTAPEPGDKKAGHRRLTIRGAEQLSQRLLNIAFWPTVPAFYDPAHSDGTLSLAFLALGIPMIGEMLKIHAPRHAYLGPKPRNILAHARNVLRAPGSAIQGASRALWSRLMSKPSLRALSMRADLGTYALHYHAESEPNPESRVTLGDKTDGLGLPKLKVNLLFSDNDAQSVVRSHDVLDQSLRKAGKAQLEYFAASAERAGWVLEQAMDGYHQMGTTRMGTSPKDSVVDKDCRVHGVDNLYVASSSVFPTGSHAHPTLLAAALGLRVAKHIADGVKQQRPVELGTSGSR